MTLTATITNYIEFRGCDQHSPDLFLGTSFDSNRIDQQMEIAIFLIGLAALIIFFKIFGLFFKAVGAILSVPFEIFGFVFGAVFSVVLIPATIVAGLLFLFFVPFFMFDKLLVLLLVMFGIYLITRK